MNKEVINAASREQSDEMSLTRIIVEIKKLYFYLSSKWIIIVAFAILGGILGFTYAIFKKPVYHATSTFVLEEGDKSTGLGQYAGLASIAGIDLGGGGGLFAGDNILELYKSRSMIKNALLENVVYKDGTKRLIELYIDFSGLDKRWKNDPTLKGISFKDTSKFTLAHDSIFNLVIKDINKNVLVVGKSDKSPGIYQVQVNAQNQVFAKAFADQIVTTVNNFYISTKTKKAKDNLANLQHQTDSVRAVMNRTIYSSAATLDATPNLNPSRLRLRVPVESARANAETNKLILGELVKNLELAKLSLRREVPLIQLIDEPVLPLERTSTGKVMGTIVGMLAFLFLVSFVLIVIRLFNADKDHYS
jgi:hypothetical protein